MRLNKEEWTQNDIKEFQDLLFSLKRDEKKCAWEQNITKTNLPCLAILSKDAKEITKEIAKGNFLSFLDLNLNTTLTNSLINAGLISKIKDFETKKKYLNKFLKTADNWASIDSLEFNIKNNEDAYLQLAQLYVHSKETFTRRAGVRILFEFLNEKHINKVFEIISSLKSEQEYYVNMAISWLVCEAFVKCHTNTLKFLKSGKLSRFVQNKAISKCRDSFRVSKEDKEMLKELRC